MRKGVDYWLEGVLKLRYDSNLIQKMVTEGLKGGDKTYLRRKSVNIFSDLSNTYQFRI